MAVYLYVAVLLLAPTARRLMRPCVIMAPHKGFMQIVPKAGQGKLSHLAFFTGKHRNYERVCFVCVIR